MFFCRNIRSTSVFSSQNYTRTRGSYWKRVAENNQLAKRTHRTLVYLLSCVRNGSNIDAAVFGDQVIIALLQTHWKFWICLYKVKIFSTNEQFLNKNSHLYYSAFHVIADWLFLIIFLFLTFVCGPVTISSAVEPGTIAT